MKKVLITVPNAEKWIHKETALFLLRISRDKRYDLSISLPTYRPLANNQHHIINDFIKGNYDYWLSVDADVAPIKNPLDLIELDKDIVGIPIPLWRLKKPLNTYKNKNLPVYYGAYKYDKKADDYVILQKGDGLREVDAIGGGCFVMARRVFNNKLLRTRGWWRVLNEDGTVRFGNDLSFCRRAKKEGFEIWAHWDYTVSHFNEIDLRKLKELGI